MLGLPLSAQPWDDAVVDFGCEGFNSIPFNFLGFLLHIHNRCLLLLFQLNKACY